jgi:hypothetical protein
LKVFIEVFGGLKLLWKKLRVLWNCLTKITQLIKKNGLKISGTIKEKVSNP